MSLILDALRKSDRQRQQRAAEQLRWGPGPASRRPARPPAAAILLAIVALGLVGIGAWLVARFGGEIGAGSGTQIMENEPATVAASRPATERDVRSLRGELANRDVLPSRAATGTATETATGDSGGDAEAVLIAPLLAEKPAAFRQRLPELVINVHAWTANPAQRFVLINMQRYGEGDRLREGPRLRQVTPDGAVLEYDGELFTLPRR